MSDTVKDNYDTSIGTSERSARSATKFWAIILGFVFVVGLILLTVLFVGSGTPRVTDPGGRPVSGSEAPGP